MPGPATMAIELIPKIAAAMFPPAHTTFGHPLTARMLGIYFGSRTLYPAQPAHKPGHGDFWNEL